MRYLTIICLILAAAFLGAALAAEPPAVHNPGSAYFPDVVAGSPHDQDIGWLAEYPVTRGYEDGTYRPGLTVRRDQMATYIMRQAVLDQVATIAVVDNIYFGGYYFGYQAYLDGRITYEQYLAYQRALQWLVELYEYEYNAIAPSGTASAAAENGTPPDITAPLEGVLQQMKRAGPIQPRGAP